MARLQAFDPHTRVWDDFELTPAPCARLGHTTSEVGGRLFVCGGCSDSSNMKPGEGGDEFNDVWLLDTREASGDLTWSCVSPLGRAPAGSLQRCHAAARLGLKGKL